MSSPWKGKAANSAGGDYAIPSRGAHNGVLVALVDLGTHTEEFTDQKTGAVTTKDYRKLFLAWELTSDPHPDGSGRNFIKGRVYNKAFGPTAAFRKVAEVFLGHRMQDGEEVDISAMLGMQCTVNIEHSKSQDGSKTYANISSISDRHPQVTVSPPLCEPLYLYALDDGEFDPPFWLPEYDYGTRIADILAESHEGRASRGQVRQAAGLSKPVAPSQPFPGQQTAKQMAAQAKATTTTLHPDDANKAKGEGHALARMQAPPKPPKPPAEAPAEAEVMPPAKRWWVQTNRPGSEVADGLELLDLAQMSAWANAQLPTRNHHNIRVCPEDGTRAEDWKLARDYQIDLSLPF